MLFVFIFQTYCNILKNYLLLFLLSIFQPKSGCKDKAFYYSNPNFLKTFFKKFFNPQMPDSNEPNTSHYSCFTIHRRTKLFTTEELNHTPHPKPAAIPLKSGCKSRQSFYNNKEFAWIFSKKFYTKDYSPENQNLH